jgi:hypothetical protein
VDGVRVIGFRGEKEGENGAKFRWAARKICMLHGKALEEVTAEEVADVEPNFVRKNKLILLFFQYY